MNKELLLYVGTCHPRGAKGVYLFRFDATSGRLETLGLAAETRSPIFITLHPSGRFLYATGETPEPTVNAFAVSPGTGKLTFLNRQPAHGMTPCYVSVDRSGRVLLVANYTSGTVASFPLQEDGKIGEVGSVVQHEGSGRDPKRQEAPHAHSIILSADSRFALVGDLGADRIVVYRLDPATGRLALNDPPWAALEPGAGPRHLAFHPNGRTLYAINELDNTMTTFAWDATRGALERRQSLSTIPADFTNVTYCADVCVAPSGRFLYGSNRGHDSIAIYAIDESAGKLSLVGIQPTLGKCPRGFVIDPTGNWLIVGNQESDSIVVFRIDPATGLLSPNGQTASVSMPACLKFLSAEQ